MTQVLLQSKDTLLTVLSGPSNDKLMLIKLEDGAAVKKIAEYDLEGKKIQRIALDANLHHGKSKATSDVTEFSNDNQFYIERSSGASSGMPISMMAFDSSNFGGVDED